MDLMLNQDKLEMFMNNLRKSDKFEIGPQNIFERDKFDAEQFNHNNFFSPILYSDSNREFNSNVIVGGYPMFKRLDNAATYLDNEKLREVCEEYLESMESTFLAREFNYEIKFSEYFIKPSMEYYTEVIKHTGKVYNKVVCL